MMDASASEPAIPEVTASTPKQWCGEPDTADAETIAPSSPEEASLEEPGYGHGV